MPSVFCSTPQVPTPALLGFASSAREPNTSRFQQFAGSQQNPVSSQVGTPLRIAQRRAATVTSVLLHAGQIWLQAAQPQVHGNPSHPTFTGQVSLRAAPSGPVGSLQSRHQSGVRQRGKVSRVGRRRAARPNNSLNLRANGMSQSPRHSAGVHYLCRGLCAMPSSPG
jgi:hypothetical protein